MFDSLGGYTQNKILGKLNYCLSTKVLELEGRLKIVVPGNH